MPLHRLLAVAVLSLALVGLTPSLAEAAPLGGATQVTTGKATACARLAGGQVRCWGANDDGEVGDGSTVDRRTARLVRTFQGTVLSGVAEISAGRDHTCARLASGQVRCWGRNDRGQLGDTSTTPRLRPVPVRAVTGSGNLTGVVDIDTHGDHTCAALGSGQARCWGAGTTFELGHGTDADALRPVVVRDVDGSGPLTGVRQVASGAGFSCARVAGDQARCWGLNNDGQVGDGSGDTTRPFPTAVTNPAGTGPLGNVAQIDSGETSTCVRTVSFQARCWGEGVGRMGNGSNSGSTIAVIVRNGADTADLAGVAHVSVGGNTACARLTSGQVRCWGQDQYGQLGDGPTDDTELLPVAVQAATGANLTGVAQVSAGGRFGCARLANGQVRCWGINDRGQVGDDTTTPSRTRAFPVQQ